MQSALDNSLLSASLPAGFKLQRQPQRLGTPSHPSPLDRLTDAGREQLAMDADAELSGSQLDIGDFSAVGNNGISFNASLTASRSQLQFSDLSDRLESSLNDSFSKSFAMCNFLSCGAGQAADRAPVRNPNKAICTVDRRTARILTANSACGQLFGQPAESLIGQRLMALVCRRGEESRQHSVAETSLDDSGQAVALAGKLLQCRTSGRPLSVWAKDTAGEGTVVALEPVNCVRATLSADPDGRVTECSDLAQALLQPAAAVGQHLWHLLPKCRPPPPPDASATFDTVAGEQPCSLLLRRTPSGYEATLTLYCNVSGLLAVLPDGRVHSVHPLLARLLLGHSARRLVGQCVSSVLPGFRQRHLLPASSASSSSSSTPSRPAVASGCFVAEAEHSSGRRVPVQYHLRQLDFGGGQQLLCLWLSRLAQPDEQAPAATVANNKEAKEEEEQEKEEQEKKEEEEEEEASSEMRVRYEVELHLGRGAYGFVKSARRLSDNLPVVVKFVRKSKLSEQQLVEHNGRRLPREAAILSSLRHPSIVPLLEAVDSGAYFELVMPRHGRGMDLFEFIDREPRMDEPLASFIFRQMSSAVAYLHDCGIAHRDLKDENVIIDEQFKVMLIDFGAAAFVSRERPFSVFCGTMEYCAPEILLGHKYYGPEADVWSLGVTLYTLVFGENPFFDMEETLKGNLKPAWKPSAALGKLLRAMLQVDPNLRATIKSVEQHQWVKQKVDMSQYTFESVLPNCHFAGNVGSDYRAPTDDEAA